ncbi:MAG: glycoside hydrolase family 16 protein [Candidatus Nanopelagicaceae bacterium]
MRREISLSVLLTVFLVVTLPIETTYSADKSISGSPCKKLGIVQTVLSKKYVCAYLNKKLVWKLQSTPKPVAPPAPTWAQIEAERVAAATKAAEELQRRIEAEAKAAAELKAKQEAEAKAAAELKAKQEAEAKAAKVEAERPKVQGLTIGDLLWGDDFKGTKDSPIDTKYWSSRNCHRVPSEMGGGACFGTESNYYAPSAIKLDGSEDGAAVITTTRATWPLPADAGPCLSNGCAFVSGRFDTHGKVAFQYGFIEARIKMPSGSGNHPAFWMLGDNINQVGWPTTGEMDITEIHSNDPTVTTAAINYATYYSPNSCCSNHKYTVAALNVGVDISVGYHTYAVAWLPNSISYYVDNKLISTTSPQTLGGYWSFNDKFFLILNNAVNSVFSGPWDQLQSSTMSIDWVRSYQLNGQGEVFTK